MIFNEKLKILNRLPVLAYEKESIAIISDIHLGYEEAMASQGVYLPKLQLKRAKTIINEINKYNFKKIVIAGDLKHVFEKLTRQERAEILEFMGSIAKLNIKEIILVKGNHDTYVSNLLKDLGIQVEENYLDLGEGLAVTHGHKIIDNIDKYQIIIMGHEHPSVEINLSGSKIRLQALLKMPLKNGSIALVLPPIGLYQTGTVVNLDKNSYLSPISRELGDIENIVPIIVDREIGVIELPRLGNIFRKQEEF
ncbi:metallophosphoesterase [Caldisphaera sp.]|uniref:metallophosphoesterase n=1 Tax=Caldisphaera sp. TaxID=2060322 RepID=UPI0025C28875|nr:metallophosphoesterase [Caldisphaera sp.]